MRVSGCSLRWSGSDRVRASLNPDRFGRAPGEPGPNLSEPVRDLLAGRRPLNLSRVRADGSATCPGSGMSEPDHLRLQPETLTIESCSQLLQFCRPQLRHPRGTAQGLDMRYATAPALAWRTPRTCTVLPRGVNALQDASLPPARWPTLRPVSNYAGMRMRGERVAAI